MTTIGGYTEKINYRELSADSLQQTPGFARIKQERSLSEPPRHDGSTAKQPMTHRRGDLPDVRGILDSFRRSGSKMSDSELQDALDDMVLSGDLSDEQADEIYAGLKQARDTAPNAALKSLDGLKGMGLLTEEQRAAAAAALSEEGSGIQALVEDGTLTQDQLDAVLVSCRGAAKLKQARQAYKLMQHNPLARAAGRQYGQDASGDSMAADVLG